MTTRRFARRSAALWGIVLLLASCSLPADEGVTPIDPDGLPPELVNTTTTSTTTTVPTTVPPPTSLPPETSAPTSPAPTTTPPRTAPVTIYYTDRATDGMQGLRRDLPEPLSLERVVSDLESPPPDLTSYGVRSSLKDDLIGGTTLDRGVLTVSLNSTVFDGMSDEEKRRAIAQMVLTFTSFGVPGQGNIGSIIFQVDGQPIAVPIADGTARDPGQPVVFDDFASLVVGATGATTTTAAVPGGSVPPTQTTAPPTSPTQ